MTVRAMRHLPDPVLRQKAKRVSSIDSSIQRLIDDMIETMQQANGVGLAAPQIGVSLRVIVIQMPSEEPIALINPKMPTVAIIPKDDMYEKMVSNIQEVKSRRGPVIAIANRGDHKIKEMVDDVIEIPETLDFLTPILAVMPCQLLAYYCANFLSRDIDKPRNLAKSVTVE